MVTRCGGTYIHVPGHKVTSKHRSMSTSHWVSTTSGAIKLYRTRVDVILHLALASSGIGYSELMYSVLPPYTPTSMERSRSFYSTLANIIY